MTATIEVSASFEVSQSVIVAEARETFDIKASVSAAHKETMGYEHAISAKKYGHAQFVNWANRVTVTRYVVSGSNCKVTDEKTGSAVIPNPLSWGYRYWETAQ